MKRPPVHTDTHATDTQARSLRESMNAVDIRATTVVAVRRHGRMALGGDGQVTMGDTVVKTTARKVRELRDGAILAGFAGAVADAFTLFEKLEEKLERYPGNLARAVVELAKDWRTDRYLRRLDALLAVGDETHLFLVSGQGDVIQPDDDIVAIGSGGSYALAAARALRENTDLGAAAICRKALEIAGDICVYTNRDITVLELPGSAHGGGPRQGADDGGHDGPAPAASDAASDAASEGASQEGD